MYKLFVGWFYLFVICTLGSAIMEGGGGIVVTQVTVNADAVDLSVNVTNTEGFLDKDWLWLDAEKIKYDSKTDTSFDNLTRGYEGTDPAAHPIGTKVYTEDAAVLNQALGFNIMTTESTTGDISALKFLKNLLTVSLPRMIMWDYAWIKLPGMQIFRVLGYCMSAGLVITFAFAMLQMAQSILIRR